MGKVEERQSAILEALSKQDKIEVSVLAEDAGVSLVTIRKDLTELEERGLLKREQGYAFLEKERGIARRLATNYVRKRVLAKRAAALVQDGETIMIEGGSCCLLLAEEISRTKKNVTIVTNSIGMTQHIVKGATVNIVLLGGDYLADAQVVVGPVAKMGADMFHVSKLFTGTDGYVVGSGFTSNYHLVMDTVRHMAKNAAQIVVVTESEKFPRRGVVTLFTPEEVDYLVTDSGIPSQVMDGLIAEKVEVLLVEKA